MRIILASEPKPGSKRPAGRWGGRVQRAVEHPWELAWLSVITLASLFALCTAIVLDERDAQSSIASTVRDVP
jgi:hypothetical protein